MRFVAPSAQDMIDTDSPKQQSVGDEAPMTGPRDCFRTHQGDLAVTSEPKQLSEAFLKGGRSHVISESPEGFVTPPEIP